MPGLPRFVLVPLLVLGCAGGKSAVSDREGLLANERQLTFEGRRSKEASFSRDGGRIVFQSEREPGNPYYQTYLLDLGTGRVVHVSPGVGRTTRGDIHPEGHRVLFDSTHHDPRVLGKQERELEERAAGDPDRFVWDYDAESELYVADLQSDQILRLTKSPGYDAEAVYSPDGEWIAFASNRAAFTGELERDDAELLEIDPAYFIELYLMKSDGSGVRRLTERPGYDGGPVFSPDGERIAWRRFEPEDGNAEIYTMRRDGSDPQRLTSLDQTSWATAYHPSGDYLIFSSNRYGLGNYELYIMDASGGRPARVTQAGGYDGLPSFSPDGRHLAWTGRHADVPLSQIYVADWNDREARRRLDLGPGPTLAAAGPASLAGERAGARIQDFDFDPGGIVDPVDERWSGGRVFSVTRGLARSAVHPAVRAPLYLVSVPVDLILLPYAVIRGFF